MGLSELGLLSFILNYVFNVEYEPQADDAKSGSVYVVCTYDYSMISLSITFVRIIRGQRHQNLASATQSATQ